VVPKLNNCLLHKRTHDCLNSANLSPFLDTQQAIRLSATSLSLLFLSPPPRCDASLALRPPSLLCPSLCDKEEGLLQALLLPEVIFQDSLNWWAPSALPKNSLLCSYSTSAQTPWQNLLASQNDQAYIPMMGFDCESFDRILEKFGLMFSGHTPFNASGMIAIFLRSMAEDSCWTNILFGTGFSMDTHKGGIACIAACFWSHLFQSFRLFTIWNLAHFEPFPNDPLTRV